MEFQECQQRQETASNLLLQKIEHKTRLEGAKQELEVQFQQLQAQSVELENLDYNEQLEENNSQLNESKNVITRLKNELQRFSSDSKAADDTIEQLGQLIAEIDQSIIREQKRLNNSGGDNLQKLKNSKETQEKKLHAFVQKRDSLVPQIEKEKSIFNDYSLEMDSKIRNLRTEISGVQQERRKIAQSANKARPENSFEPNMQQLIREIQRTGTQYRGEVIGPVGMCIELKDQYKKWKWVIELLLQKALRTILVENRGDANRLRDAMKRARAYADITIRQREVFDFSSAVPRGGYLTMADVLKFSNDNVLCHLVDANKIHSTLLIPNRAEAEKALYNDHENTINAVICFVDKSAFRISKKNGTLQSDPIRYTRQIHTHLRTTAELDNPLASIDAELAEMQRELQDLEQEKRQKLVIQRLIP
ncbi:unnamed protein product [Ambrosiozyma monospora]|uniref:Unnamed protein product n=1 Tax=Ambrosiozyma monospora TaxID=43982 RepID=A0ACB5TFD0_AMBMO|nr:unnamed protein product [Ambrosiozyma monospora]